MTTFWPWFRIAAAALGLAAIVAQLVRTVSNSLAATTEHGGDVGTVVVNFFSFFTIESNVLAVVTLATGAVLAWRARSGDEHEPRWFAVLLACATTYMIVTGIVYNTLLRGYALDQGVTVPWSNEVLHVVIPLVLALDLLLAPRRRALGWGTVGGIVAFPIVWVVYTLVRGPLVTSPATGDPWWYPYPFLNPNNFDDGYGTVAIYVAGIAVAIAVVAVAVVWIGRRRARPGAAIAPQ